GTWQGCLGGRSFRRAGWSAGRAKSTSTSVRTATATSFVSAAVCGSSARERSGSRRTAELRKGGGRAARWDQLDRERKGSLRFDRSGRHVGGIAGQERGRRPAEIGEPTLQHCRVFPGVRDDGRVA